MARDRWSSGRGRRGLRRRSVSRNQHRLLHRRIAPCHRITSAGLAGSEIVVLGFLMRQLPDRAECADAGTPFGEREVWDRSRHAPMLRRTGPRCKRRGRCAGIGRVCGSRWPPRGGATGSSGRPRMTATGFPSAAISIRGASGTRGTGAPGTVFPSRCRHSSRSVVGLSRQARMCLEVDGGFNLVPCFGSRRLKRRRLDDPPRRGSARCRRLFRCRSFAGSR